MYACLMKFYKHYASVKPCVMCLATIGLTQESGIRLTANVNLKNLVCLTTRLYGMLHRTLTRKTVHLQCKHGLSGLTDKISVDKKVTV